MINFKNLKNKLKDLENEQTYKNNILIIDGTNRFITCFSVSHNCSETFIYSINKTIEVYNISHVICLFDGKNNSNKRKKKNEDYKSGRSKKVELDEEKEFAKQEEFSKIYTILNNLPIITISVDDCEADDVIAYLSNNFAKDIDNNVYIMSTDKDFYQLISTNISIFNPISKKLITLDSFKNTYNMLPSNFIYYKAILGDNSDSISGIKGIGDKTFKKMFKDMFLTETISANNLIDVLQNNVEIEKYKNLCIENYSTIQNNITLMDLNNNKFFSSYNIKSLNFLLNKELERISNIGNYTNLLELFRKHNLFTNKYDIANYFHLMYINVNKDLSIF